MQVIVDLQDNNDTSQDTMVVDLNTEVCFLNLFNI